MEMTREIGSSTLDLCKGLGKWNVWYESRIGEREGGRGDLGMRWK